MIGRLLAICGWMAGAIRRPLRRTPLRRLGAVPVVFVAILLLALAAAPVVIPLLDPQPQTVGVQDVFDDAVTEPDGWVRLRGRLVDLEQRPTTDHRGPFALLVDADETLRAIVVVTEAEPSPLATLTGHLEPATVVVEEELPMEARVAGTPPRVVPDRLLVADAVPTPERQSFWPLAIPPLLLAVLLLVGARVGYPVFRPTVEVDVLSSPLGAGERVPAAYGGRIGPTVRDLDDPGGALLLVRRGERGNLLTAQPLPDEGSSAPAPAPVPIGGGWTSGRLGYLFTLGETVPALVVRSEQVDATLLFARIAERDRVAALITIDR